MIKMDHFFNHTKRAKKKKISLMWSMHVKNVIVNFQKKCHIYQQYVDKIKNYNFTQT